MRLTSLSLRNFRNLAAQRLEFPGEGVAIIGPNAQGKTNLLEAIYYLETLRSFRGAPDAQLVQFGCEHFRVAAELEGVPEGAATEVAAAFDKVQKRKRVQIDGVASNRLSDGLGQLAAVVFSPADVELINGGPAERRRHLDVLLSLNHPGYLAAAQQYRHALAQRNAALRNSAPWDVVEVWDQALTRAGAKLVCAREAWVDQWSGRFSELYTAVSGGEGAAMAYRPNVSREDGETWSEAFARQLTAGQERDTRMGNTGTGPHRDELRFMLLGESRSPTVRDFGSGGQRRTAALALRLVEAETIQASRGHDPIVLLDDVFAELDAARSERVQDLLDSRWTGQVILTAPKDADVTLRGGALVRWSIEQGVIQS